MPLVSTVGGSDPSMGPRIDMQISEWRREVSVESRGVLPCDFVFIIQCRVALPNIYPQTSAVSLFHPFPEWRRGCFVSQAPWASLLQRQKRGHRGSKNDHG